MSDEIDKAATAVPGGDTIFGKILRKEIPCNFIYEDERVSIIKKISNASPISNEALGIQEMFSEILSEVK